MAGKMHWCMVLEVGEVETHSRWSSDPEAIDLGLEVAAAALAQQDPRGGDTVTLDLIGTNDDDSSDIMITWRGPARKAWELLAGGSAAYLWDASWVACTNPPPMWVAADRPWVHAQA